MALEYWFVCAWQQQTDKCHIPSFHSLEIKKALCLRLRFGAVFALVDALSSKVYRKSDSFLNKVVLNEVLERQRRSSERAFVWNSSTNFGRHGGGWKKTSHDRSNVPWTRTGGLPVTRINRLHWSRLHKTQESSLQFWLSNMEKSAIAGTRTKV